MTALAGSRPDRVPVGPFVGYAAARLIGATLRRYYTDGTTIARAQVELHRHTGQDILLTAADTYYIAEGFGLQTEHHRDALPTVREPLLETLGEVDHLTIPDPHHAGRMPVYLQALRELRALMGDTVALRGTGTGPFSLAAYLYGEQRFLMLLAEIAAGEAEERDVRGLHRLLEITTETTIAFLRAQLEIGLDIVYMGDSLASTDMISPDMYRTWAFPWHSIVFGEIGPVCRDRGAVTMLHICGGNEPVLKDFEATGVNLIEIDHKMDLAASRRQVKAATSLIGNLDPVNTILEGTPGAVTDAARGAIEAARGTEGRFILGTGCFVPLGAPLENLVAMVEAARGYQEQAPARDTSAPAADDTDNNTRDDRQHSNINPQGVSK
jgi:uroporphyrinogen decarboxylase